MPGPDRGNVMCWEGEKMQCEAELKQQLADASSSLAPVARARHQREINGLRRIFQNSAVNPVQLRADADNVGLLVGGERLFGIELMLQHGKAGFRGVVA